ncbi:hypothetical protein CU666_16850 [Pseudomonas syringae pv. actinidifoliorum]|nr:hypothetical protein [Pseudomonas syringae pv. actinidifoliorum]
MNNTFIHRMQMPEFTGTYFLGEQGERGNSPYLRGFKPFPLIECMGNRGNTNMFLNIRASAIPRIWLSLFPVFGWGTCTPLKAPETLAVPTVPPFPRFFFTGTYGSHSQTGEIRQ